MIDTLMFKGRQITHRIFILVLLMGSGLLPTYAADWTDTFIEGVNSYSRDGEIEFNDSAKLYNAPQNGNLPSYDVGEDQKSCVPPNGNTKKCKSGGYIANLPEDRIPFNQCLSTSNNNIGPPDFFNPEIEIIAGEYGDVVLSGGADRKVTFITSDGIYKIKSLTASSGTLELAAGQYWIESLQINSGVNIIFPATGTVSFFVRNSYTHLNSSLAYSAAQFLLYAYRDVTIAGNVYLRGYVVAEGELELEGGAKVEGGVTSDDISLIDRSWVYFSDTAASINVVPDCGVEPVLPVVPLQCPAEQAGVAGITYRTYDATSWKTGQYTSPVDHDDFNDLVDTVKTTTNQLGESIESRVEGYGVSISPHSSQGDNYAGIFEGYLDVPETGKYTFGIDGDDSIELLIDDQVVVGFYGIHGQCGWPCETGDISLAQGTHKIEMRFHEATGAEAYLLYWQPPSASSLVKVPESAYLTCPFPQFEFGRVRLDAAGNAVINFENSYASSPVVILMPTINGLDGTNENSDGPSSIVIDSLSAAAVAITQDEPPHKNNYNPVVKAMEEVDYFVMEPGYRFLERGKALQAGTIETKTYQGKYLPASGRGYEEVDFPHDFGADPVMIGQALTRNNSRFITVVINDVDDDEFEIAIEASEINQSISNTEVLGYVAGLGNGTVEVNGKSVLYEFSSAKNHGAGGGVRSLSQQCLYSNQYIKNYSGTPVTIANKNSRKGGDGGWVRRCLKENFNDRVSFVIDEDMHRDSERSHLAEDIGYFAFEYAAEPPATNHYRIQFSSEALSCTAKTITIKSCANDNCSTTSSISSSVELTKDGVKYSDVSFTGETDTEIWHGEGGLTTIGLGATSPAAPYFCYIDGTLVDNSACTLNFAEAGFIFNIDNFLSNKPQKKIEVSAVKKSNNSTQCIPTFAGISKTVNFWSEYVSPGSAAIVTGKSALINGTDIGKDASNATPFSLAFNSQGKAEFELNYSDAGKIAIHAKYTAASGEDDEGLVMEGSDNTVRYPVGLCIKPEATCLAGDASCDAFKVAGEIFDMSIQAMAWQSDTDTDFCDNLTTANYVQADIELEHNLKQPLGGELGTLGLASYDHIAKVNSLIKVEQFISEVGVFTIKATPPNSYLGEAITIPAAESEPVGRFYPNDFEVDDESMLTACGGGAFYYMDEPVPLTMTIRARNLSRDTTQNYFGDFASGSGVLVGENSNAGVNYQTRLTGFPSLIWGKDSQGIQEINSDIQFTRLLNSAVDGPYTSMAVGLQMSDDDGVLIALPNMNAATVGDCSTANSCNAVEIATQHYRHGRIVLENAYGPETEILRMPVTAEYWSGAQWMVNTLDNCSQISSAALPATGVDYAPALAVGQTVTRTGGGKFTQGRFELLWQSLIANPNRYRGQVTAPLDVPEWLQWYWNWNSDGALSDPRASAFFGTYRGNDKVISWREVN